MNLRCRQGDVCMVRNSGNSDNWGKVVTCRMFIGDVEGFAGRDYWWVDQQLESVAGRSIPVCRDAYLFPLLGGYPKESVAECIEAPLRSAP